MTSTVNRRGNELQCTEQPMASNQRMDYYLLPYITAFDMCNTVCLMHKYTTNRLMWSMIAQHIAPEELQQQHYFGFLSSFLFSSKIQNSKIPAAPFSFLLNKQELVLGAKQC